MGDYADMAASEGVEDWRGSGARRGAQRWPGDLPPQYTHVAKRCRGCGLMPLYWERDDGRWRLHAYEDGEYVLHVCAPNQGAKL